METTKILSARFIDILFDGRNKDYGAYELRIHYARRLGLALLLTVLFCLLVAGIAWWRYVTAAPVVQGSIIREGFVIREVAPNTPVPPVMAPPPKADVPQVKQKQYATPRITRDIDVVEPPPSNDQLTDAKIGTANIEGINTGNIVLPPEGTGDKKGLIEVRKKDDADDGRFAPIEIEASYPGGIAAWKRFLERNLRGEVPVENGAQAGNYTVMVKFIVDVDGSVSQIQTVSKVGFGMEEEAIRVIQKSGKWKPAIQNGREVKAYRQQPVTFQVFE